MTNKPKTNYVLLAVMAIVLGLFVSSALTSLWYDERTPIQSDEL
jgi:hypothetical protein